MACQLDFGTQPYLKWNFLGSKAQKISRGWKAEKGRGNDFEFFTWSFVLVQWHIQSFSDADIPVWASKFGAQIKGELM